MKIELNSFVSRKLFQIMTFEDFGENKSRNQPKRLDKKTIRA